MSSNSGTALLEAIVALSILSIAGLTAVTAAAESIEAVRRIQTVAGLTEEANAFLNAVSLWPREDLNRRLGERRQGRWWLRIDRIRPGLYGLVLRDTASGRAVLRTVIFRMSHEEED